MTRPHMSKMWGLATRNCEWWVGLWECVARNNPLIIDRCSFDPLIIIFIHTICLYYNLYYITMLYNNTTHPLPENRIRLGQEPTTQRLYQQIAVPANPFILL